MRGVRRGLMGALVALVALLIAAAPVLALDAVQDAGNMFSAQARQNAATTIAQIEKDTGKSVVVRTVPNLGGKDISAASDQAFNDLKLNGVLIFASKDDKKLDVRVARNSEGQISATERNAIRDLMLARFGTGDFDGGLTAGVARVGTDLRRGGTGATGGTAQAAPAPQAQQSSGVPWLLILVILAAGIGLAVFLARRAARNAQGPIGGGGYGPGSGGGYGPQQSGGYGQNYGPGGGGSGFGGGVAGGVLGGIGGAIVGNAIYDRLRGEGDGGDAGSSGGWVDSGSNNPGGSDDSSGSWGDSGGSSGDWGGGGDSGGGDSGGGGGDSSL